MKTFRGTWRLVKLALRLDRVKLSLWVIAIVGIIGSSAVAVGNVYSTHEERVEYAVTTAPSIVARAFGGLVNGPSIGSILMVELFYFTAVLIAFMSTLTVVRHTRKAEESGASELISSAIIGRYASLTAAIIVAILANLVTGFAMWLVLQNVEAVSGVEAFGFSATLVCVGLAFAGVAGVAAQLSETGRGANSMAGGAIGAAFIVRAVGDGFGSVGADGLSASPLWVSWLSPLGWGFQIHPLTDQNWWIFSLFIVFVMVSMVSSFVILRHRDIGLGVIPSRSGRATAKKWLRNTFGLSWRLQRTTLIGWSIGFVILGITIGGMAHEFSEFIIDNPEMAKALGAIGGEGIPATDIFFGAMFGFAGVTAAGYVVQSLLKIKSEETAGHLEKLLATRLSKVKWLFSHAVFSLLGTVFLLLIAGAVTGLVHVMVSDDSWEAVSRLTGATLIHLPALLVFWGSVIFMLGIWPKVAAAFAWGAFIGSFLVLQFGMLLNLPSWIMNISPFSHTPSAPVESWQFNALLAVLFVAVFFAFSGFLFFKRRDITTTS